MLYAYTVIVYHHGFPFTGRHRGVASFPLARAPVGPYRDALPRHWLALSAQLLGGGWLDYHHSARHF